MADSKTFTFGRQYGPFNPGTSGEFDVQRWEWLTANDFDKPEEAKPSRKVKKDG
jgi:hypothetical protein